MLHPAFFPVFGRPSLAHPANDRLPPRLPLIEDRPALDAGPGDDFVRLGPRLASALPTLAIDGPSIPSSPLLTDYAHQTRQQLHTMEAVGQRLAGMGPANPWDVPIDPAQAMALLQLLVMVLMHGGRLPDALAGGGADGGGRFDPNRALGLAPGRFAGVPSRGGRDLGSLPGAGQSSGAAGGVSAEQLRAIAPNLSADRAAALTPHLNRAMAEAGITTQRQQAAFIAQLAQESGGFRYFEELASGAAYEGRRDLGNTQPGDGRRFKGRGPIQLTGRANYRAAGRALGLDLENNPELVSRPDVGFRVAAWFWNSRGLNGIAESGDFREVTRRINGGYNGLAVRQQYYQRALRFV